MQREPTVLTFGTFDLLHIGHVNLLRRAATHGRLVVGVSTDELNLRKKGRLPVYDQQARLDIIRSLRWVDDAFYEESLEMKAHYLKIFNADVLVMGDDWAGKFDCFQHLCRVLYYPRTPGISTTDTLACIRD